MSYEDYDGGSMAICAAKNVSRRIILAVALTYFKGGKAEDSIRPPQRAPGAQSGGRKGVT